MNEPRTDIEFFESNRQILVSRYTGKVVVIRGRKIVSVYEDAVMARRRAQEEFPAGSYLIRQIEPIIDAMLTTRR